MLFVPGGGLGVLAAAMRPGPYQEYLLRSFRDARIVGSVCIGALPLAVAGLLDGFRATTHWAFFGCLSLFHRAEVVNGYSRCMIDGNRVTGGGLSSGFDTVLTLAGLLVGDAAAQQAQLAMQYNHQSPYQAGDPLVAPYDGNRLDRDGTRPYLDQFSELIRTLPRVGPGARPLR